MTLRFGIIGCGEITSKRRAEQIDRAEGTELQLAMDIEEWAAKDIGQRFDIEYTTDEEEVLSDPDVGAVYISTPHHLHAEQTIRAADSGKHVVIEKPIATSVTDGREMIDACEAAGVKLTVPLARFTPTAEAARLLVEEGLIGSVVGTRISSLARKPDSYWTGGYTGRVPSDWRKSATESGGGILVMNSIHAIDRFRYVTGLTERRVYAEADTFVTDVEVEDFVCVTIRYDNGAIGSIEGSSFAKAGVDGGPYDRIYGERGTIVLSDPIRINTAEPTRLGEGDTWHDVETQPVERNIFERFAAAVEADGEMPIPPMDALRDLAVVRAAYQAAEDGTPVEISIP